MSEMVVEKVRQAGFRPASRRGGVPQGGHEFVRQAMLETGCSEAVAVTAVRLVQRRHRPQLGQLRGYLARFSPADRAHWVAKARRLDPARTIEELAAAWGRAPALDGRLEAGRARAIAARAFARAERERVGGMQLLDAELDRLRASSDAAARVIASIDRALTAEEGGGLADGAGLADGGGLADAEDKVGAR